MLHPFTANLPHTFTAASNIRNNIRWKLCMCSANVSVSTAEELKSTLRRACAPLRRGKKASRQEQLEILRQVEALEALESTQNPARSPLISGRWSLLYTGPGRADDLTWEARTGGVEGPVLAALKPVSANAVTSKGITQVINAEGGRVQNIAEFRLAGGVDGFLNVEGTVQPVEPMTPDGEAVRVDVKFTSFSLKVGALPALRIPLEWASPTGWVDTTYLDSDFRIGRGDKGSVFVTQRQGASKG